MIHGACLCKEIKISLKSELLFLYNCHCEQCRAFSGASHATNASIVGADLEISDPNGNLAVYETPGGKRHFCKNCGSPIFSAAAGSEEFPTLHVGIVAEPPAKSLDANLWVSEKCPWTEITEGIPNYQKAIE